MDTNLLQAVDEALGRYRLATTDATDQAREDYLRLIAITEKLVGLLRGGDLAEARRMALGFSRQASDSYSAQPPEFKPLASLIAKVKKEIA